MSLQTNVPRLDPAQPGPLVAFLQWLTALVTGNRAINPTAVLFTTNLAGTYANGTAGVGAILRKATAGAFPTTHGVVPFLGMRVLLTAQTTGFQCGYYHLTTIGDSLVAWVLTRVTSFDASADMVQGTLFAVTVTVPSAAGTLAAGDNAHQGEVWAYTGASSPTVGTDALTFSQSASSAAGGISTSPTYGGAGSYQPVAADLNLLAGAGKNVPDTAFLAAMMGNVLGDALTKTGNYLAGAIGAYSITGSLAARFGAAGIIGLISDGVTEANAAVLAVLDGDSAVTRVAAMFGVKKNNSTPGSGADYGLDLQGETHDSMPVIVYERAAIRMGLDVCDLTGTATPTDGVNGTGVDVAGPGSLYRCTGTPGVYINTGSKASPTWKVITHS